MHTLSGWRSPTNHRPRWEEACGPYRFDAALCQGHRGSPQQIQAHTQPLLDHMTQYAYSPGRECSDAILGLASTLNRSRGCSKARPATDFECALTRLRCYGGLCLSLDLSKAFDTVCRIRSRNPCLTMVSPMMSSVLFSSCTSPLSMYSSWIENLATLLQLAV